MQEERKELIMQLAGVTGAGCVGAVWEDVRRLDPTAEVEIDLEHKRATIRTFAQSLEGAEARTGAGFEATGMTLGARRRPGLRKPLLIRPAEADNVRPAS